jgi:NCAIR mutase (PurE)-related protein
MYMAERRKVNELTVMHDLQLRRLLEDVGAGRVSPEEAHDRVHRYLRHPAVEDIGFARIDHDRARRQGMPEVVFGPGKLPAQIATIAGRLLARGQNLLVTRTDEPSYAAVLDIAPTAIYHEVARAITVRLAPVAPGAGTIAITAAGTADLPVAEEAAVTAEFLGNTVDRLYDVGVAGIHRLFGERHRLEAARVVLVVAGMEGALASVVGGLVRAPVVAVPTSVGYGSSFGGLAALLAMLNSCAAGVTVVNIDNGFGGAVAASIINHL